MKHEFFSGISEVLSRVVALILVLLFYVIFFLGKGNVSLNGLMGQGTLILGSIVLYELIAFVFFELFSLVEARALAIWWKDEESEPKNQEDVLPQVTDVISDQEKTKNPPQNQ